MPRLNASPGEVGKAVYVFRVARRKHEPLFPVGKVQFADGQPLEVTLQALLVVAAAFRVQQMAPCNMAAPGHQGVQPADRPYMGRGQRIAGAVFT